MSNNSNDGEYWRGRNIQQNLDIGKERARYQTNKATVASKVTDAVVGVMEGQIEQARLETKLQKYDTAASNAQIAALKRVLNGEITRDSLNRVVGKDKYGEDQTEFGRIAKDAAFAKADELGVKREVITDWWFC